jgi:hypothetical protein
MFTFAHSWVPLYKEGVRLQIFRFNRLRPLAGAKKILDPGRAPEAGPKSEIIWTPTCYFLDLACLVLVGFAGFAWVSFAVRILPTWIARVNSSKSLVLWSA